MKYFRILFIFGLILAIDGQCLPAAGPANFSGTWVTDMNAPEGTSLNALLEAHGVPWVQRRVMDTLSVTQVITQTEKSITIQLKTAMGIETLTFTLDGVTEFQNLDKTLGKVESRSFWEKNGQVLVTVAKFKNMQGRNTAWTTRRHLADKGRTMIVDHSLKLDDGRNVIGKRILRKQ